MIKKAFLFGLLTLSICEAKSCRDLCERFGDYEACQKVQKGVLDCSVRMHNEVPGSSSSSTQYPSGQFFPDKGYTLYTRWIRSGGATVRFRAKVTPGGIAYRGESKKAADDYGLTFNGKTFWDDHMIGAEEMHCRQTGVGRYSCSARYGEYRRATIYYKLEKNGRFDLRFYGVAMDRGGWEQYVLRLASDGKYLYEQYFNRGHLRQDISERYPIEAIVPLR